MESGTKAQKQNDLEPGEMVKGHLKLGSHYIPQLLTTLSIFALSWCRAPPSPLPLLSHTVVAVLHFQSSATTQPASSEGKKVTQAVYFPFGGAGEVRAGTQGPAEDSKTAVSGLIMCV